MEDSGKDAQASVFRFMDADIAAARHMKPGSSGTDLHLPGTDDLTARIKVYVTGGENKMHSHPLEDHAFFILAGQAMFHIGESDRMVRVERDMGVLLPRGTKYWFTSTGNENLVMLRVGSSAQNAFFRLDGNGREITSDAEFPHVEGEIQV